jgi:hypothetical protein
MYFCDDENDHAHTAESPIIHQSVVNVVGQAVHQEFTKELAHHAVHI